MKTIAERRAEAEMQKKYERQMNGITDQYNSLDNKIEEEDFERILKADLEFAPKKGESFESYHSRAKIYAQYNAKTNIKTHILGPKGAWFTHRNPSGCFACSDTNLIAVLLQTIKLMVLQHPKDTF